MSPISFRENSTLRRFRFAPLLRRSQAHPSNCDVIVRTTREWSAYVRTCASVRDSSLDQSCPVNRADRGGEGGRVHPPSGTKSAMMRLSVYGYPPCGWIRLHINRMRRRISAEFPVKPLVNGVSGAHCPPDSPSRCTVVKSFCPRKRWKCPAGNEGNPESDPETGGGRRGKGCVFAYLRRRVARDGESRLIW